MYCRPVAQRASFIPRLDRLGPGVRQERANGPRHRRDLVQPLGDLGVDRQEEVARGVVDQLRRLFLDRLDHPRVAVSGRCDRDAGVDVEEEVAVDVLDGAAAPAGRHERIRPRERRAGDGLVGLDHRPRVGAGSSSSAGGGLQTPEASGLMKPSRSSPCSSWLWGSGGFGRTTRSRPSCRSRDTLDIVSCGGSVRLDEQRGSRVFDANAHALEEVPATVMARC